MSVVFNKWTILKFIETLLCISCWATKRATDGEASRLFLYLQKVSREWSLLNNVTWGHWGAALADAVYGGYTIITAGLLIGHMARELPRRHRITEFFLLGVGTLLFVILGGLEFAAIDSLRDDLIDNAAILGALSILTAVLFLVDLGGPRQSFRTLNTQTIWDPPSPTNPVPFPTEIPQTQQDVPEIHTPIWGRTRQRPQRGHYDNLIQPQPVKAYLLPMPPIESQANGIPNGVGSNGTPSSPTDPGYVQYTAKQWGQRNNTKTPKQSPV